MIVASTLIGMSLDWFGVNPIMDLYHTAAFNGLAAPPLMALIINNKQKGYNVQICQLESKQHSGVDYRTDNDFGRDGTNRQPGDGTVNLFEIVCGYSVKGPKMLPGLSNNRSFK